MGEPPILWNPFSRTYRVLPNSSMGYPPGFYVMVLYGFGYDSKNDDYKVLKTAEFRNQTTRVPIRTETQIYSLRSNAWKKIEDFPYSLPFIGGNSRAHVNGSFHTLVYTAGNTDAVNTMAFSVETEKHYEVMLPIGIRPGDVELSLSVVRGCLCLICKHKSKVVIWVMKEYGVEESRCRLLTISPPAIEPNELVKPLVYSRDGNKILLNCDDNRFVWYELRKNTVDEVHIDSIPGVFYAHDCVESLVSVEFHIDVKKQGREQKGKGMGNKRFSLFTLDLILPNRTLHLPRVSVILRDDSLAVGFKLVL